MIVITMLCCVSMVICAPMEVDKRVNAPQANLHRIEESQQDAWSYFTSHGFDDTFEVRPIFQRDATLDYGLPPSLENHYATYMPIYPLYDYQGYHDVNGNHLTKSDEKNLKPDIGDAKVNPIKIVVKPIVKPLLFINRVQLAIALMINAAAVFGG